MCGRYKSIILVNRSSELPKAFSLYDELLRQDGEPLILTRGNIDFFDKKYSARNFTYYQKFSHANYYEITRQAYGLFETLAEKMVHNDSTLRKLTIYNGVSLWDLSVKYLFLKLLPVLYNLNMAETILDFEQPLEIHTLNNTTRLQEAFNLACGKRQVKFFIHQTSEGKTLRLKNLFEKAVIFVKQMKRSSTNLYFLIINLFKSVKLNKKYKIIFFAPIERWLNSLLPVISKYSDKERLVVNTYLSGSARRLNRDGIPFVDFRGYLPYVLLSPKPRKFLKKIKNLFNKKNFCKKQVFYNDINITPLLYNIVLQLIEEFFPEKVREVDIVRKIILSYRPQLIVVTNHSSEIALTAKALSVPIAAVQGEHIDEFSEYGPVIADIAFVDGSDCKEYLLKKGFPVDDIQISGPVKFDIMKNRLNNKDFNIRLNVAPSKKMVIFAIGHGCYDSLLRDIIEQEKTEQLRSVCKAIRNIEEAHLVIKLHPFEKDVNSYRKIAREAGLSECNIIRNADIWNLLYNCNLLITHVSTVGYDAILLDKNVISLCASAQFYYTDDIWGFGRYGAAIIAEGLDDLENCIRRILFNSETISMLKKGRREYKRRWAYKLDGKASERVKEAIDKCDYKIAKLGESKDG